MSNFEDKPVEKSAEQVFFETAKYYEELKEQMNKTRDQLDAAMAAVGVGKYLQDPGTMAVYKIVKPQGTFIYFRDMDYERTAFEGEKRGSLSKKEAQEQGFILLKE